LGSSTEVHSVTIEGAVAGNGQTEQALVLIADGAADVTLVRCRLEAAPEDDATLTPLYRYALSATDCRAVRLA
jgi:hypothetical protein